MSRLRHRLSDLRIDGSPWVYVPMFIGAGVGAVLPLLGFAVLLATLLLLRPPIGYPVVAAFGIVFACLIAVRWKGPDTRYANNLSVLALLLLAYAAYEAVLLLREPQEDE